MSQGIETLLKMDAFSLSLDRRCFPSSSEGGGGVPTQYREWRGLREEERRVLQSSRHQLRPSVEFRTESLV